MPPAAARVLAEAIRTGQSGVMSREIVNAICEALPGAEVSDPFGGGGHDCWKVGGKMFALVGSLGIGVSVKTEDIETVQMLIELGRGEKAPYLHRSWVLVPFDRIGEGEDEIGAEELRDRVLTSYRIIRSKLPKKVQAALTPEPE